MTGASAGVNCWFEASVTDSFGPAPGAAATTGSASCRAAPARTTTASRSAGRVYHAPGRGGLPAPATRPTTASRCTSRGARARRGGDVARGRARLPRRAPPRGAAPPSSSALPHALPVVTRQAAAFDDLRVRSPRAPASWSAELAAGLGRRAEVRAAGHVGQRVDVGVRVAAQAPQLGLLGALPVLAARRGGHRARARRRGRPRRLRAAEAPRQHAVDDDGVERRAAGRSRTRPSRSSVSVTGSSAGSATARSRCARVSQKRRRPRAPGRRSGRRGRSRRTCAACAACRGRGRRPGRRRPRGRSRARPRSQRSRRPSSQALVIVDQLARAGRGGDEGREGVRARQHADEPPRADGARAHSSSARSGSMVVDPQAALERRLAPGPAASAPKSAAAARLPADLGEHDAPARRGRPPAPSASGDGRLADAALAGHEDQLAMVEKRDIRPVAVTP